jgi:dihydrofolate reductase
MIAIIVAKANNNVIGSKNDLPWYLPADLKHFKNVTLGHAVVMGRNTFQSILDRLHKPLPGRDNIVLTHDEGFSYDDVRVIHEVDDIKQLGDVFIIGGAEVYTQTIDLADTLYVTEVHASIEGDVTFPEIDSSWQETSRESHKADEKNQYDYDFVVYKRA